MYLWDNLTLISNISNNSKGREEKLKYFKNIITNSLVLEAIGAMDKRYKRFFKFPSIVRIHNLA